jgi:hypothetical protein
LCCGCGLISGLDPLQIEDGGPGDVATDGIAADAPSDGGIDALLACEDDATTFACPSTCNGSCWLGPEGPVCGPMAGAVQFQCTRSDQCNGDAGEVCCLRGNITIGCPVILMAGMAGIGASCAPCPLGNKLCVTDDACGANRRCVLTQLSSSDAASFGICL